MLNIRCSLSKKLILEQNKILREEVNDFLSQTKVVSPVLCNEAVSAMAIGDFDAAFSFLVSMRLRLSGSMNDLDNRSPADSGDAPHRPADRPQHCPKQQEQQHAGGTSYQAGARRRYSACCPDPCARPVPLLDVFLAAAAEFQGERRSSLGHIAC